MVRHVRTLRGMRAGHSRMGQGGGVPGAALLNPLTLSPSSLPEGSAEDTVVGAILGKTISSALAMTNTAGGRFKLAGSNVVAGATATDYETATTHNVTVRETLGGVGNSPKDNVIAVAVSDVLEPDALVIEWASDGSDNTPQIWVVGGNVAVGDAIHFFFDTVNTFNSGSLVTPTAHVVTLAEFNAGTISFDLGTTLADSTWYAEAYNVRGGLRGIDSNIVSQTISTTVTSPPSMALWGWWDTGLSYTETSGTPSTPISADGTQSGSQIDRSGNGNHLYAAGGLSGFGPIYKTNIINGLPAARYNTPAVAGHQMLTTGSPTGNSFSIFAVAKQTSINQPYDGLISSTDLNPRYFIGGGGGAADLRIFNGGTGAVAAFSANTFHLVAGTIDNTGSFPTTLQIDNNTKVTANATGGGVLGAQVSIGLFFNGYWTGDIVELLLYTAVLDPSSGDGLLARKYLNNKYNLGLTL